MTYTDYIKAHNDRIEREQQLIAKYKQKPLPKRDTLLWASTTVKKCETHKHAVIEGIIGCVIVGFILIMAIVLG